ncbi:hypothetical protein DPMN_114533 [Dreissena polymorpha]|uniref:Uncharacterized protein n=1 Tax=Dreissena polymorpha TaxID=45954 RepID=A0A9D4KK73_DREPO|nr:hypothetical protein DPMN_114533 [Dreissena polymorpha]
MARQMPTRGAPGLVNRLKGNFGWAWSMWAGAPQVEIDHIVVRDFQYQFEVNRRRNEEVIVKSILGGRGLCRRGRPRVGNGAMHNVQYQFEVNRCINEEVNFQSSSAYSVGGDSGQDGRTDRRTDGGDNHNLKSVGIIKSDSGGEYGCPTF